MLILIARYAAMPPCRHATTYAIRPIAVYAAAIRLPLLLPRHIYAARARRDAFDADAALMLLRALRY